MATKREFLEQLEGYSDDAVITVEMVPSYRISVNEPPVIEEAPVDALVEKAE